MKCTFRIAGGLLVLLSVLALAWSVPAFAQGPASSPTPNPTAQAPAASCTNVATFVTDVTIPDNTVVTPGQSFTKTWRMRNRGSCDWGAGYTLAFVSGQAMTSKTSISVPSVAPAATADLSVSLTAGSTNGAAEGFWQLHTPKGTAFGPRVWVKVSVGGTPVPAAAPPLVPGGQTLDDPARSMSFGTAIPVVPSNSAEWLQFDYDNGGNALPRPTVTILLLNGVTNGLTFEVYSPESIGAVWFNNPPVGRGTPEVVSDCNTGTEAGAPCTTNNLSWSGGFGLNGTYYVRILNNTSSAIAPQMVLGGPGLANCAPQGQSNAPITNQKTPFARIQCQIPTPGMKIP